MWLAGDYWPLALTQKLYADAGFDCYFDTISPFNPFHTESIFLESVHQILDWWITSTFRTAFSEIIHSISSIYKDIFKYDFGT